jgi:hypothetical protein
MAESAGSKATPMLKSPAFGEGSRALGAGMGTASAG